MFQDKNSNDTVTISKKKLMIILAIVLGVILLALIIFLYLQNSKLKKENEAKLNATPTVTSTASLISKTSTKTTTPTPVATQTADETATQLSAAKDVANKFMNARIARSLEQAKPYMTDLYYNSTSQIDFAGASSPGMDHFTIDGATVKEAGKSYTINVTVYLKLNGEDSGAETFALEVQKDGERYLVNSFTQK
ncbi:MAG: hypothetical protein NTZ65_00595 [Candidatus Berkelbacteria bacterium]|nr:hypothetical protein [Candidatus Berkelbacteria bacterium]